jgi:1-acyl-sn-glycerol-3-phosphate acyltransferase
MTTRTKKATAVKPKAAARVAAPPASKELAARARPKAAAKPKAAANANAKEKARGGRPARQVAASAAKPRPKPKARAEEAPVDRAVVAQIRELEAQLDKLIDEASRRDVSSLDPDDAETWHGEPTFDAEATIPVAPPSGTRLDSAPISVASPSSIASFGSGPGAGFAPESRPEPEPRAAPESRPMPSVPSFGAAVPPAPESVFDTARELLSSDFYLRKWGRLAMRGRSEEVDDFGFDPIYDAKLKPALDFLYDKYFRVETSGIASVPKSGRCLLVANHSGTLPLDGVMIKAAVKREGRDVRWLTEDFIYHMPYLGSAMNRLGAVRACQENAERLLSKEQLVAVFPEGVKGIGKLFAERYRLQRFGRGGFIKLCLRTGTPIVPVAVTGAEETNPLLFKIEHLAKALGVPYVPVTPTFPLLGPLGLLPAPTKWTIQFGEPLDLSSHGASAADDEILVGKLAERVRATIQGMLDRTVGARKSVFFG